MNTETEDIQFELENFLPYQLVVAANRVSRAFSKLYCDEFGISIPEWRVLANLSAASEVSVREIHQRVDMDKSKVSRAAHRLQKAGYVKKTTDQRDKRLVSLTLTGKGRQLMADITPLAGAFQQELLESLGDDADTLKASLARLSQTLGDRR